MSVVSVITRGLFAGLVGTVVMTISETLEMKLSGRETSTVPGQVGSKLFAVSPQTEEEMAILSTRMHWGHGIAMGTVRALISVTGLKGLGATLTHFILLWSGDATLYAALGIAPPPWRWKPQELITDLFHKGVFAIAAGATYDRVGSRRQPVG